MTPDFHTARPTRGLARYGGYLCSVGGARVAGILITSVTFPYVVRVLGVATYGAWSYVVAVCAFTGIIANPGLTTYASQQIAAHRESSFEMVPDILVLRLFASLIALGVLFLIIFIEKQPEIKELFFLYGAGVLATNIFGADYLLDALEMFHASSALRIIQQAIYASGVFLLVRSPKDILWLPASILFSVALANIAGWWLLIRRGIPLKIGFRPDQWKQIIVPSLHYAVSSFMSSAYHRTGHIIVRWLLGEYALGLYAAAVRVVDLTRNLVGVILSVMVPRLARASNSEIDFTRWAKTGLVIVVVISAPLTIGLIATSHTVVPWILGSKYGPAVVLVKWMSLYIFTASAAAFFAGTILYAMGRHREYLISTSTGAIVGVLLYALLIPAAGLIGAAIAFVLAEFFVAVSAYMLMPRQLRGMWQSSMIAVSLVSAFMMVPAVRFASYYNCRPATVISLGALIYIVLCGGFFKRWLTNQLESTV